MVINYTSLFILPRKIWHIWAVPTRFGQTWIAITKWRLTKCNKAEKICNNRNVVVSKKKGWEILCKRTLYTGRSDASLAILNIKWINNPCLWIRPFIHCVVMQKILKCDRRLCNTDAETPVKFQNHSKPILRGFWTSRDSEIRRRVAWLNRGYLSLFFRITHCGRVYASVN